MIKKNVYKRPHVFLISQLQWHLPLSSSDIVYTTAAKSIILVTDREPSSDVDMLGNFKIQV